MSEAWEIREAATREVAVIDARARLAEAMKGVDPKTFRESVKAERFEKNHGPKWITLWMVYLSAWIFLLMTFKANVWPR